MHAAIVAWLALVATLAVASVDGSEGTCPGTCGSVNKTVKEPSARIRLLRSDNSSWPKAVCHEAASELVQCQVTF